MADVLQCIPRLQANQCTEFSTGKAIPFWKQQQNKLDAWKAAEKAGFKKPPPPTETKNILREGLMSDAYIVENDDFNRCEPITPMSSPVNCSNPNLGARHQKKTKVEEFVNSTKRFFFNSKVALYNFSLKIVQPLRKKRKGKKKISFSDDVDMRCEVYSPPEQIDSGSLNLKVVDTRGPEDLGPNSSFYGYVDVKFPIETCTKAVKAACTKGQDESDFVPIFDDDEGDDDELVASPELETPNNSSDEVNEELMKEILGFFNLPELPAETLPDEAADLLTMLDLIDFPREEEPGVDTATLCDYPMDHEEVQDEFELSGQEVSSASADNFQVPTMEPGEVEIELEAQAPIEGSGSPADPSEDATLVGSPVGRDCPLQQGPPVGFCDSAETIVPPREEKTARKRIFGKVKNLVHPKRGFLGVEKGSGENDVEEKDTQNTFSGKEIQPPSSSKSKKKRSRFHRFRRRPRRVLVSKYNPHYETETGAEWGQAYCDLTSHRYYFDIDSGLFYLLKLKAGQSSHQKGQMYQYAKEHDFYWKGVPLPSALSKLERLTILRRIKYA